MELLAAAVIAGAIGSLPIPNLPSGGGWTAALAVVPESLRIALPDLWMLSGTLHILKEADTLVEGQDWRRLDSADCIEFLPDGRCAPSDTVEMHFISASPGRTTLRRDFSWEPPDTSEPSPQPRSLTPAFQSEQGWSGLRRSGYITRGIRMGTASDPELVSGLHLELSGQMAPNLQVETVLDDRSLPSGTFEGTSTTLAEFDRIYFRATSPHVSAHLGDWDLNQNSGVFGELSRRVKGAGLELDWAPVKASMAAAGGQENYRHLAFNGRDGDQGPYELTDRYGKPGITVVGGTERVYLNGQALQGGRDADYVIDYTRGTLTFNPSRPIRSDSRIEVEYQFSDQAYPRFLYSINAGTKPSMGAGKSWSVLVVSQGSDYRRPTAFEWSESWRQVAEKAGDNPAGARVSGVDSVGWGRGDYVWAEVDSDTVLVFSPPDSFGHPTGYLTVEFSRLPGGGYLREYEPNWRMFYHRWVGRGMGEWAPVRVLPLPDRLEFADAAVTLGNERLSSSLEVAVSNTDGNTLSPVGDQDNTGTAWHWQGRFSARPVTFTAKVRKEETHFRSPSRLRDPDFAYRWNLTGDSLGALTAEEVAATVGLPWSYDITHSPVRVTLEGGILTTPAGTRNRRWNFSSRAQAKPWTLQGSVSEVTSQESGGIGRERWNWSGSVSRTVGTTDFTAAAESEQRQVRPPGAEWFGAEYLSERVGFQTHLPKGQKARLGFTYRTDDSLHVAQRRRWADTRTWEGAVTSRSAQSGSWQMQGLHYVQSFTDPTQPALRASNVNLDANIRPPQGLWNAMANYRLSTGSTRTTAAVAGFVGEGNGTYRREGDRYVYDPSGDFEWFEVLTDTIRRAVRSDLVVQAEFEPQPKTAQATAPIYPLGVTRLLTRLEASLNIADEKNWQAYFLLPEAFAAKELNAARRSALQEVYFLENQPGGDGRLRIRFDESRGGASSGGENSSGRELALRIRVPLSSQTRLQVEPLTSQRKFSTQSRGGIADVTAVGVSAEMFYRGTPNWDLNLGVGMELRRDRISDGQVREWRVFPQYTWHLAKGGDLRLEGQWRRLDAERPHPGYDLTQIWSVGDNFTAGAFLDYRVAESLTATGSYQGQWRPQRKTVHSAQVELTLRL